MKNGFLILIAILIGAAPAHADEDECILQIEAITPVISTDAKNYEMQMLKEERSLTESAELADGTKVTRNIGGCAHYGFSYHFEDIPGGVPAEPDDPFALPLALLAKVPLQDDADMQVIMRSLREKQASGYAAFENDTTEWACGDAFCSLKLEPESVTVVYDFAL